MTIARDDVIGAIRGWLPAFDRLRDRVLIVGTASSLLRGIELPAGDVDVLARDRDVVDQLAREADLVGATCDAGPRWIDTPFGGQYIAGCAVGGVLVEFSTVELSVPDPTRVAECTGAAPWWHIDTIDVDGNAVPLVASELRLQSEVLRGRADRWIPIASFLARNGYDERLVNEVMVDVSPDVQIAVREVLGQPR